MPSAIGRQGEHVEAGEEPGHVEPLAAGADARRSSPSAADLAARAPPATARRRRSRPARSGTGRATRANAREETELVLHRVQPAHRADRRRSRAGGRARRARRCRASPRETGGVDAVVDRHDLARGDSDPLRRASARRSCDTATKRDDQRRQELAGSGCAAGCSPSGSTISRPCSPWITTRTPRQPGRDDRVEGPPVPGVDDVGPEPRGRGGEPPMARTSIARPLVHGRTRHAGGQPRRERAGAGDRDHGVAEPSRSASTTLTTPFSVPPTSSEWRRGRRAITGPPPPRPFLEARAAPRSGSSGRGRRARCSSRSACTAPGSKTPRSRARRSRSTSRV